MPASKPMPRWKVRLLKRTKRQILAEPKQFIMGRFFEGLDGRTGGLACDFPREIPNCGTAACIAGWMLTLRDKRTPKEEAEYIRTQGSMGAENAAYALVGSTDQADRLFYVSGWPPDFEEAWKRAATIEARAQVAAERIDHFIATEGRE